LSKAVEARRIEMKSLSKEISHIIDKQSKRMQKEGPSSWASRFTTDKHKKLHAEIESVHCQNEKIKSGIREVKEGQPDELVKQYICGNLEWKTIELSC
jgi:predicted  nucleic acid-binding Zn-ribbon protein